MKGGSGLQGRNPARAAPAHRRLVVVDPASGRQPMIRQGSGRTCVITYNGELYNTPALRQELQALAYPVQIDTWLREYRVTIRC